MDECKLIIDLIKPFVPDAIFEPHKEKYKEYRDWTFGVSNEFSDELRVFFQQDHIDYLQYNLRVLYDGLRKCVEHNSGVDFL